MSGAPRTIMVPIARRIVERLKVGRAEFKRGGGIDR